MADQLYLSLWFPNFRLQSLPAALVGVLRQFALIAKDGHPDSTFGRVAAATAYPIDWTESPIYQRVYSDLSRLPGTESGPEATRASDFTDSEDSTIDNAVAEATELLHEDTAYEFEMRWMLWLPERAPEIVAAPNARNQKTRTPSAKLDTLWRLEPSRVRITGFGPNFDEGSYEQNGHIRVDFGLDTPWTFEVDRGENEEEEAIDRAAAQRIQQNVEKLLAFTLSVEKNCGISSRLLWTESGEPLAEKLIARLQRLN